MGVADFEAARALCDACNAAGYGEVAYWLDRMDFMDRPWLTDDEVRALACTVPWPADELRRAFPRRPSPTEEWVRATARMARAYRERHTDARRAGLVMRRAMATILRVRSSPHPWYPIWRRLGRCLLCGRWPWARVHMEYEDELAARRRLAKEERPCTTTLRN